jgi:hypothetical protein
MDMKFEKLALAAVLAGAACQAQATELITNGGFETGDFTAWGVTVLPSSNGNLTVESGSAGPLSALVNAGPSAGSFFALTDQSGPGTYVLTQGFSVAPGTTAVTLKFDLFANNYAGSTIVDPIGLDHTGPANQHVRVDLLTGAASAVDTGGGVIANFYLGADAGSNPNPWTSYTIDLTGLAPVGGSYQIRFAEVDNQGFFNMGVDNVSIAAVPEPQAYLMMIAGLGLLAGAAGASRRRGK